MPRIGLLSDSHGRAATTRKGVSALLDQGVDVLLHLGDIGTVDVIDALAVNVPGTDQQIEAHVVFGNTDWDAEALGAYAQDLGITVDHPVGRLALGGGELVFCHGHLSRDMEQALAEHVKYLCHGHTHRTMDERAGDTRVINPGALFRASDYTVALLDTDADALRFLRVHGA